MKKFLLFCGLAAVALYISTAIVGAALYPGYSHLVNAISELLSVGAPNKAVLDVIFNIYGALLLLFAIGGFIAVKPNKKIARWGMGIFIFMQVVSFSWGFFPMDVPGTEPTFAGMMHNVIGGFVALTTIIIPLLVGLGVKNSACGKKFALYSYISAAIIFVFGLGGVILVANGGQIFGLTERITIGTFEIWVAVTALMLLQGRFTEPAAK